MESESNDCTQIVDLITDCETTLNMQYYTEYLRVLEGEASFSGKLKVTVGQVYKLKQNDNDPDILEYAGMTAG